MSSAINIDCTIRELWSQLLALEADSTKLYFRGKEGQPLGLAIVCIDPAQVQALDEAYEILTEEVPVTSVRPGEAVAPSDSPGLDAFLEPAAGPIVQGLEPHERTYAEHQSAYVPLRALVAPDGRVLTRWALSPEQRQAVAQGADLYLQTLTFGRPLQPVLLGVSRELDADAVRTALGLPT